MWWSPDAMLRPLDNGHATAASCIAISHSASFFATGSADQTVCLWDGSTGLSVLSACFVGEVCLSCVVSSDVWMRRCPDMVCVCAVCACMLPPNLCGGGVGFPPLLWCSATLVCHSAGAPPHYRRTQPPPRAAFRSPVLAHFRRRGPAAPTAHWQPGPLHRHFPNTRLRRRWQPGWSGEPLEPHHWCGPCHNTCLCTFLQRLLFRALWGGVLQSDVCAGKVLHLMRMRRFLLPCPYFTPSAFRSRTASFEVLYSLCHTSHLRQPPL